MKRIMFVCSGNTCRSIMAEGILKAAVKGDDKLEGNLVVFSAGMSAAGNEPASVNAVQVLSDEWGIDISSHSSKSIDENKAMNADLILTMTKEHKKTFLSKFPYASPKVYTLKEYAANADINHTGCKCHLDMDIADPYGMSYCHYKKCAEEIKKAVDKLVLVLKK